MDINEIYRSLCINSINEQNKEEIYLRNFNTFLYEKSDKVWVNGELIESKIERLLLKFSNEKGEPNIKNYEASNTLEGLPLTENDFINSERIKIETINSDNLELIKRKKLSIYKVLLAEKTKTDKKDVLYRFHPHLEELHSNEYDAINMEFDNHGHYEINKAKIYNIDLAILFQTKSVKLYNVETKQTEIVNGMDYLWTFLEGYKEGEQKMLSIEKGIHSENAQAIILDLHNNYFHTRLNNLHEGWIYVKKINVKSFNHEQIKEYGMYSGMVSKTDELVKENKNLIVKFDICEHDKETKIKTPNAPSLKEIALFHVYLGTKINKDNANDYLKDTPHKSGSKLKQAFDKYTKTSSRIYCGSDRENNARLKVFNSVILMLENSNNTIAFEKAKNELIQFKKNIA